MPIELRVADRHPTRTRSIVAGDTSPSIAGGGDAVTRQVKSGWIGESDEDLGVGCALVYRLRSG